MNNTQLTFADGINFYQPNEKTQSFMDGKLSINVKKLTEFLNTHANEKGYVNLNIMKSKKNPNESYVALDTWVKPTTDAPRDTTTTKVKYPSEDINPEDIPF